MRILLIEDQGQLLGTVSRELAGQYGHQVIGAHNPVEARDLYDDHSFDVALVDLLFADLTHRFDGARNAATVSLTANTLLVTGLTAVQDLRAPEHNVPIVLWTSGEANRRLHLLFAYEELAIRVFCSKASRDGTLKPLHDALLAAVAEREHVDPVLNSYLPADGAPKLRDTILRSETRRAIWRALALGASSRNQIMDLTGYAVRTIGNEIPKMLDDLIVLDPGMRNAGRAPMVQVGEFAKANWEFFLDDAVRMLYP
jgi:DNA-binding NarL/FixJ family response regulator